MNSTTTKHGDILHTQLNAEETPKQNYPLIEQEKIEGTPFTLIKQNDKYFIVMGNTRITDPTLNKETTLIKLETEKWLIILHLVIAVMERQKEWTQYIPPEATDPETL